MKLINILNTANPDDLRFLLQQYNISEEPSEEVLAKAILEYGDDFITDLYIITNLSSNFDTPIGPSLPDGSFTTEDFNKKTGVNWDKIKGGFQNFANSLKGGLENYIAAKNAFANNSGNNTQIEQPQDNTWKWAIGIGAALIIILILFVILRKKS